MPELEKVKHERDFHQANFKCAMRHLREAQQALHNIKNGKDNPCAISNKVLGFKV